MKLLQFVIGAIITPTILSFKPNHKTNHYKCNMKMIGENNINEIMKYENIIPETTYNSLLSRIKHHDISKIYFNSL